MIRKVLLGYDGSASSDRALTFAIDLARTRGAELHVLSVVRPLEVGEEVETTAVIEQSVRQSEKQLRTVHAKVSGQSVVAHYHVAVGHPAEQIVRYAEGNGIDHIVVGHRGHGVFERWLLGSVARQVIAYAPCSVTVCREPKK